MYETEVNQRLEAADQIPKEALQAFSGSRDTVSMRSVLPWAEHCTECVWPTCYSSCELYEARPDGRCRRFVDGMVRIDSSNALNGYLLKIRFKRWAKLWTVGNINLHSVGEANRIEKRDYRIGSTIQTLVLPTSLRSFASSKRYSLKKRNAQSSRPSDDKPSSFMLECYNPGEKPIRVSLTVRSQSPAQQFPYQTLLEVRPGFNRIRTPFQEINAVVPLEQPFHIDLIPNDVADGATLYFGLIDFVQEAAPPSETSDKMTKVKGVIWDLDNTLWDGILIEDGPSNLRLKPGMREVIEALDHRGILQSVASKNNLPDAMEILNSWNLAQYFIFPQVSWQPKSESIATIIHKMNIGPDTVAFIDDSPFELEQVRASIPEVRVIRAEEYQNLLARPEFTVPVTEESASRRKMYQVEESRQEIQKGFGEDYRAFLKHCDIRVGLQTMTKQNLERVYELAQRTNQMNFSGNRYDRLRLSEILETPFLDTYVIQCEDKFGSYGVVGFAIIDKREPRLTDLMFSCRIQAKRVEHAFLGHVVAKHTSPEHPTFYANYRKTPRNEPSGKVFSDMGFSETEVVDGVTKLKIIKDRLSSDDHIIHVFDQSSDASSDSE